MARVKTGKITRVLYPEFTRGESSDDIATLAGLASEIWTERFTPITGPEQVGYMFDKFQSTSAKGGNGMLSDLRGESITRSPPVRHS